MKKKFKLPITPIINNYQGNTMTNMNNKFEADTGKILDIVINSLYSEREIFLRELISTNFTKSAIFV